MSMTLLEYAKTGGREIDMAIALEFANTSLFFELFPFEDIQGDAWTYSRVEKLPGVAFRGYNQGMSEGEYGILNPQVDSLAFMGRDIAIDKTILDTKGQQRRLQEIQMTAASSAARFVKTFLKGSQDDNVNEFNGLQTRIIGNQLISTVNNTGSAGGAVSFEDLLFAVKKVRNPRMILMNRVLSTKLSVAAMATSVSGYVTRTQSELGNPVTQFAGVPIVEVEEDENGDEILGFNEPNPDGSTGTNTSIYVVSTDMGAVRGIQGGVSSNGFDEKVFAPRFTSYGVVPSLRSDGTRSMEHLDRLEWHCGIKVESARSCARIAHISNAAFTLV